MKRRMFKLVVSGNKSYIQQHQKSLFGTCWITILSFIGCKNRCKQIVDLLNECDTISKSKEETT